MPNKLGKMKRLRTDSEHKNASTPCNPSHTNHSTDNQTVVCSEGRSNSSSNSSSSNDNANIPIHAHISITSSDDSKDDANSPPYVVENVDMDADATTVTTSNRTETSTQTPETVSQTEAAEAEAGKDTVRSVLDWRAVVLPLLAVLVVVSCVLFVRCQYRLHKRDIEWNRASRPTDTALTEFYSLRPMPLM